MPRPLHLVAFDIGIPQPGSSCCPHGSFLNFRIHARSYVRHERFQPPGFVLLEECRRVRRHNDSTVGNAVLAFAWEELMEEERQTDARFLAQNPSMFVFLFTV